MIRPNRIGSAIVMTAKTMFATTTIDTGGGVLPDISARVHKLETGSRHYLMLMSHFLA